VSERGSTPVMSAAGSAVIGRPRAVVRMSGLRFARALLVLATGVTAAVPVIVATVHAVQARWMPGADQAIIATRAHDVFTSHTPLVGQYTTAAGVMGRVTSDPGPMLDWLIALPARFGSPASITVTMASPTLGARRGSACQIATAAAISAA